ncbi:MAG: DUF6178 family protein [Deltaproteobacteria bacterium]
MSSDSNVVALVPWSMSVRRAVSRRRVFDLLDDKDAPNKIRALDPLETYYAVKEVGLEDAGPILALLAPEQIGALVDVEAWHHQRFDPQDLLLWLYAFREGGLEALAAAGRAMDREVLALLLRRRLWIAMTPRENDTDPDPIPDWLRDPPDEILPLVKTPDGRFVVAARIDDEVDEVTVDEEDRKGVLQIVDDLYKQEDWEEVAATLRLALTDLSSSMEEDALRFRNARLEDFGFPPLHRAIEIYGPLDPDVLERPAPAPEPLPTTTIPARYTAALDDGLFSAALSAVRDAKQIQRIEGDLVAVANRTLVADGAEPGELEALTASLSRLRGYLEIALAHQVEPARRIEVGADRLERVPIADLARVGYTITLRLGQRARALSNKYGVERLEDDDRALFEALGRKRPRLSHLGIERGFDGPDDVVWVEDRVARLEGLLAGASALQLLDVALEGAIEPPPAERTIDVLIATAAARAVRGDGFVATPLDAEALADLADRLGVEGGPRFGEADVVRAQEALAPLEDDVRAVMRDAVEGALVRLADALWPLVGATIDPRFVGVVLRRLG